MKRVLYTIFVLLTFQITVNAQNDGISNCLVNPNPIIFTQPDGSKITVKMHGTRLFHYIESLDGYTLVLDSKNALHYAKADAGDLIPSGVIAHESKNRDNSELSYVSVTSKHLRYSDEKANFLLGISTAMNKQDPSKPVVPSNPYLFSQRFPSKGKRHVLVLLIQFKDQDSTFSRVNFSNMLNQHGYNGTNSFADYYKANSFGNLQLDCDVFGWYTSKNNMSSYGHTNGDSYAGYLVAEAIDAAHNAGVDFSKYDNDGDGNVDGLIVVHSGVGAETSLDYKNIWSNASDLTWIGESKQYNSVTISHYTVQAEEQGSNTMNGIGVFCHEFGHLLGLPDLYNTKVTNGDYESAGVGDYDVMAGGSYLNKAATPASFCAFVKTYFKWVTPVVVNSAGPYTLKPAALNAKIYKFKTPVSNEYYLLENRYPVGFDSALPSTGLAIWHIDSKVMDPAGSAWSTYNNVESDLTDPGVYLEQADGNFQLDKNTASGGNRGDGGDLFPGSSGNTSFNDKTTPNANTWTGKNSGISIQKIAQNSDSTVTFNFGAFPSAAFAASTLSNEMCLNNTLSLVNNSNYTTSYLWDFGDSSVRDTNMAPKHNYARAGSYTIKLVAKSSAGADSSTMLMKVDALPGAQFVVTSINGGQVNITNSTVSGDNFYTWIWGDNVTNYKSTKTVSHTYKDTGIFAAQLIALNGTTQCVDTFDMNIHVATLTGIAGQYDNAYKLSVSPNPFASELVFTISLEKPAVMEIALYNSLGQKLREFKKGMFNQGMSSFDDNSFGNLNPGMYFVGINAEGQAPAFIKVIKQ